MHHEDQLFNYLHGLGLHTHASFLEIFAVTALKNFNNTNPGSLLMLQYVTTCGYIFNNYYQYSVL